VSGETFGVYTVTLDGLVVGDITGGVATIGDPPEGIGELLCVVLTSALSAAASITVVGEDYQGNVITAYWDTTSLPAGTPAGVRIPPTGVYDTNEDPILWPNNEGRLFYSVTQITFTGSPSCEIQTCLEDAQGNRPVFTAMLDNELDFKASLKGLQTSDGITYKHGESQGEVSLKLSFQGITGVLRAAHTGQVARLEDGDTSVEVKDLLISGTWEATDRVSVNMDGTWTTVVVDETVISDVAQSVATTLNAAKPSTINSVTALPDRVRFTYVPGQKGDLYANTTDTGGTAPDAQKVQIQVVSRCLTKWVSLQGSRRPYHRYTLKTKRDGKTETVRVLKAKAGSFNEQSKVDGFQVAKMDIMLAADYQGNVLEIVTRS